MVLLGGLVDDKPTAQAAVEVENLSVRFATEGGTVNALQQVSLKVAKGDFVSLLGPSGCGKSTLLRVVADLLQPSEGQVKVLGDLPAVARERREFGFVFQEASLLPWRSALENVRLPMEVGKFSKHRSTSRKPEELLELVGLAGFEKAYPRQLSGGMRQRVAIARALVANPTVLLMDEPFGALDEIQRDRLNVELLKIWQKTGITILFVTHSIAEAVFLSSRVVVMSPRPGRIKEVIEVSLPYPRNLELKDEPRFGQLTGRLRQLLAHE